MAIVGAVTFLAAFGFGMWTLMSWIGDRMKSTKAYQQALPVVLSDARVVATLGAPVEPRGFVTGNLHEDSRGASLVLSQLLVGAKAQGRLTIVAFSNGEKWTYEQLEVRPESRAEVIAVSMPEE